MIPSINRYSKYGDYEAHGQIVQELRTLSRQYKIPIITATQNTRGSENVNQAMSNNQVGDSIRKVRFSDFIYMCRQDPTKDPFDAAVSNSVITKDYYTGNGQLSPELLKKKDQICSDLIPFEIKITKSKDAGKDAMKYMLFCKQNLRIYNNIGEYLNDLGYLDKYDKLINNDLNILSNVAVSSISEDFAAPQNETSNNVIPAFAMR